MPVDGLSREELRDLLLSVGTGRKKRRLSPVEVAQYCAKAKVSIDLLTTELLLSKDQLRQFQQLLLLSPKYHPLVDWGKTTATSLGFSSAWLIGGRVPDSQIQGQLVQAAIQSRFSKTDIINIIQIYKNQEKSMKQCIQDVIELRPKIETTYMVMGSIMSEELTQKLAELTQYQRNQLLQNATFNLTNIPDAFGARLGVTSFTLLVDEYQHQHVASVGQLEETLTSELLKLI